MSRRWLPAGTELVDGYRADLAELQSLLAEYADNATRFPAEDLESLYTLAGIDLVSFLPGGEGMSEYLDGHPDIAAAHAEAPACSGGS